MVVDSCERRRPSAGGGCGGGVIGGGLELAGSGSLKSHVFRVRSTSIFVIM